MVRGQDGGQPRIKGPSRPKKQCAASGLSPLFPDGWGWSSRPLLSSVPPAGLLMLSWLLLWSLQSVCAHPSPSISVSLAPVPLSRLCPLPGAWSLPLLPGNTCASPHLSYHPSKEVLRDFQDRVKSPKIFFIVILISRVYGFVCLLLCLLNLSRCPHRTGSVVLIIAPTAACIALGPQLRQQKVFSESRAQNSICLDSSPGSAT